MYYPYFRGKQYELITIRENAQLMKDSSFVPIIEPVKESTKGLKLAIERVVVVAGGNCILVVNPDCGDHCPDSTAIRKVIFNGFPLATELSAGILLTASMTLDNVSAICDAYSGRRIALVHKGFEGGSELADMLADAPNITQHIFVEEFCGKLYRRRFRSDGRTKVLLRDGFQKRINRDHPKCEPFSDLHATFADEENMDGFGDFLIVGDDYTESGGPAYAVVIHLTYIDKTRDDAMYIRHYMSDRKDTPADPAGKFAEALAKLVADVKDPNSQIVETSAVQEFLYLHDTHHFPGLGYVKKLSMQHHIETLADYGAKNGW